MERLSFGEKIFATKLYRTMKSHFEDSLYTRFEGPVRDLLQTSEDLTKHSEPMLNVSVSLPLYLNDSICSPRVFDGTAISKFPFIFHSL